MISLLLLLALGQPTQCRAGQVAIQYTYTTNAPDRKHGYFYVCEPTRSGQELYDECTQSDPGWKEPKPEQEYDCATFGIDTDPHWDFTPAKVSPGVLDRYLDYLNTHPLFPSAPLRPEEKKIIIDQIRRSWSQLTNPSHPVIVEVAPFPSRT